jgi:two-component system OmpR family response regulator
MRTDSIENEKQDSNGDAARPLKVIVIDDERDLADITGALFSAYGIANKVVYSAEEGLRAIERDTEINAVFSDIMMPGMTGLNLAMTIKERRPELKIVLTSGFTSPEMLAMHENVYLFTRKPYRIETVIELFRRDSRPGVHRPV